jgi:hypothetical protein
VADTYSTTSIAITVGDSNLGFMTFTLPTIDISYCTVRENKIVKTTGSTWSTNGINDSSGRWSVASGYNGCTSICLSYDLYDRTKEVYYAASGSTLSGCGTCTTITFKIESRISQNNVADNMYNGYNPIVHLSPTITATIQCGNAYTISEASRTFYAGSSSGYGGVGFSPVQTYQV